ncbi:MAG: hypothetical protein CL569_17165 [Alphaproteobacteria bacterium]|nr:hypothetical protein [Alphaproteobacteria bacterium]|tara:strand:- start:12253 stop:12924 length:672 start_codon:yes stop_codon:yes gene_type:complete
MTTPPKGILIIFTDFPLDEDDVVDEWYTREHVKSRVIIDGFHWGKRYEAILGSPRYVAVYGTDDVGVLASQAYFEAGSNPDQAEREQVPKFYNTRRTICSVTASAGEGEGGVMGFLALSPEPGREEDLRAWITHMAIPQLVAEHGVVSAHLWETNAEALTAGSRGFTPTNTGTIDWIIAWEGARPEDLQAARAALLKEAAIRAQGAKAELNYGFYRLLLRLEH